MPSPKVDRALVSFGFVVCRGHLAGNCARHAMATGRRRLSCRIGSVKLPSRRRMNGLESECALQPLECIAPSRTLTNSHRGSNSVNVRQYRPSLRKVAGIEAFFQFNQRANPAVKRTRNGKPRMAFISFSARRASPLRAAYLER